MIEKSYSVSVIMPVYKVSDYVSRAILSLAEQTYDNFELIIVDDCGGDDSIEKAAEILNKSKLKNCYKVVTNPHNLGVSLSRGKGMIMSKGEYIIHLDSDDYFEPDLLERLISVAKESSSDMVICNFFKERPAGYSKVEISTMNHSLITVEDKSGYVKEMLRGERASALWNKLIKRELFDKADIRFYSSFRDDLSTSPLLVLMAQKIDFVGEALIHYVLYNSNSESASLGHLKLIANTLIMLGNRFNEIGISMDEEILAYKAITKRRMIIHKGINRDDLKMALSLFPEVSIAIRNGKNPEKKIQYRILLRLAAKDNFVFRTYRAVLTALLSV